LRALVHGAADDARGAGGDPRARPVEGLHRDLEALALGGDEGALGHLHVLEDDVDGVAGALAELLLLAADLHAGGVGVDDKHRDALVAQGGVLRGEHGEDHAAWPPLVIQRFWPLITNSSPWRS
jgi:hypothetical protein